MELNDKSLAFPLNCQVPHDDSVLSLLLERTHLVYFVVRAPYGRNASQSASYIGAENQ